MGQGLLIPPWYQDEEPSRFYLVLVTFIFGASTACAGVTAASIIHQIHRTWRRTKRVASHPYIVMIVAEWASSVALSGLSFAYFREAVQPSFWLYFSICGSSAGAWPPVSHERDEEDWFADTADAYEVQVSMHIIINRIAVLICDRRRVRTLQWSVTLLIGAINISVFIIWIPARLQISPRWVWLNSIWDRVEKGILLLLDAGLNVYFIYLVRTELIDRGLAKYWDLYWFNMGMIFISISLDVLLIGIMSLPGESTLIYMQFHPLMYLIKLKIEMNMAELITKIVKASSSLPGEALHQYADSASTAMRLERRNRGALQGSTPRNTPVLSTVPAKPPSPPTEQSLSRPSRQQRQPRQQQDDGDGDGDGDGDDDDDAQGWELTRLPGKPDNEDVGEGRDAGAAEGGRCVVKAAWGRLLRPALMRNMSEMTQLETGAGYLDLATRHSKTRRMSGTVGQWSSHHQPEPAREEVASP